MTNDDARTGSFWDRHNKRMQDPEHEARFNTELARIRAVDAQVNANDDLRTALAKLADEWDGESRYQWCADRLRALLAAHPAEVVSDTRREDVAEYTPTTTTDRVRDAWVYASTGGESGRTYQEAADLFNEWLAAHEAEVRERIAQDIEAGILGLAGHPGVAREVFASVDTDELAEVLIEAYTDWMGAGCPGSSTSFQAEAVKAHLLKEDS